MTDAMAASARPPRGRSRWPARWPRPDASSIFSDPLSVGALNALVVLLLAAVFLVRSGFAGIWMSLPHGETGVVDFAAFWSTAKVVLAGHATQAYDWVNLKALLEHASGTTIPKGLPVYYPPVFLMLVAPLGWLPYRWAFAAWVVCGLLAYAAAVRLGSRRLPVLVIALAGVGVFSSAMVGQNGIYSAALLAGGLALCDRRPVLAGVVLGLLCYKPQLAVLAPVALVAGGRWRTLATAAVTAVAFSVLAGLVLGWDVYGAFFTAGARARHSFATTGWLPWAKVQTMYGAMRQLHLSAGPAFALAGVVAFIAASAVAWLWCTGARACLRVAAAAAGAYLATPYAFSYDAALLGMATAFILADVDEARPLGIAEVIALAAAFVAPYLANPWPTTAPSAAILLTVAVLRARRSATGARITEISPRPSHPRATVEASS